MRRLRVGCLPVVQDERLVGIITEEDFMDLASKLLEEQLGTSASRLALDARADAVKHPVLRVHRDVGRGDVGELVRGRASRGGAAMMKPSETQRVLPVPARRARAAGASPRRRARRSARMNSREPVDARDPALALRALEDDRGVVLALRSAPRTCCQHTARAHSRNRSMSQV